MKLLKTIKKFDPKKPKTRNRIIFWSVTGIITAAVIGWIIGRKERGEAYRLTKPYSDIIKKEKIQPVFIPAPDVPKEARFLPYIDIGQNTNAAWYRSLEPVGREILNKKPTLRHRDLFKRYADK